MLSNTKLKQAKPKEKDYKLYDGKGLYILVTAKGRKYWRFDFTYRGKRKTMGFGVYPEVSLKEARERRSEARKLLRDGINPVEARSKQNDKGMTFRELAMRWYKGTKARWTPKHAKTIKYRLERYVFPFIGSKPLEEIKRSEVLLFLKAIYERGNVETARRICGIINNIFDYGLDLEIIKTNPAVNLKRHLPAVTVRHYPTILDPAKVGKLLRDIENYRGDYIVKCALQVLIYTFVRPGELRDARWDEFNIEDKIWEIPAERMKSSRPHRVFLANQVVEILQGVRELTGHMEHVFPGRFGGPISDNSFNKALRTMGYNTKEEITAHGFRAMARTLIHEKLGYSPEVIEHQLAHAVPDILGEAYNRTRFHKQRRKMMQDWADYLDGLRLKAALSEK